jgi:hypothetical protein
VPARRITRRRDLALATSPSTSVLQRASPGGREAPSSTAASSRIPNSERCSSGSRVHQTQESPWRFLSDLQRFLRPPPSPNLGEKFAIPRNDPGHTRGRSNRIRGTLMARVVRPLRLSVCCRTAATTTSSASYRPTGCRAHG